MSFKALKNIIKLESADSTNKFLKENDLPGGTVVVSGIQTGGYGKQGAQWHSGLGGLWFSFLVRKKITKPYIYVILSSIAITDTLKKYGIKAQIKWPNDIYIRGKKAAGILIENDVFNKKLVTGIGINVNNEISAQVRGTAVNVKAVLKKRLDLDEFFETLLARLDFYLTNMKTQKPAMIRKWTALQMDIKGREVRIGKLKGKVVSVSKTGTVTLVLDNGRTKNISGEIFFI